MKVIDLIIKLQQMPPNMEVMLDVTSGNGNMFHFKEINEVEEIETALKEKMVVISTNLGVAESEEETED
jgi:hypothetical protein